MAKSRAEGKVKKRRKGGAKAATELSPDMAPVLLTQATSLLHTGQPDEALPVARKALACLSSPSVPQTSKLPAMELLGEIYLELGDPDEARKSFEEAVTIDPEGAIGDSISSGADKFLWLAQLCEEGGQESVNWFDKGAAVLRRELGEYGDKSVTEEEATSQELKKRKLANALCGAAEVYMTDLSWEDDAEARCEALVTEACMVAPEAPEPLQTLASVRISQTKLDDARAALSRSLDLWSDLSPEDPAVPDFPTRISLARLLMEATMEEKALDVLERLVSEDDTSVEAWYLGGWCLNLMADKQSNESTAMSENSKSLDMTTLQKSSRIWLENSLRLCALLEYEDERLKEHAEELVEGLNNTLGAHVESEAGGDDDDEPDWEDEDEAEEEGQDEDMEGV